MSITSEPPISVELTGGPFDGDVIEWYGPLRPRIEMRCETQGPNPRVAEYVVWYGQNKSGNEAYLFRGYKS